MSKFKPVYEFEVNKTTKVAKTIESKNEKGEPITITQQVSEKVPVALAIQKPTRFLREEAELYFNIMVSKGIQAGLLPQAILEKKIKNEGGTVAESEGKYWGKRITEVLEKQTELNRLALIKESDRTEEQKSQFIALTAEIQNIEKELRDFELSKQELYNITAETRARTKTIQWWLLMLLHQKNDKGEWVPFFSGESDDINDSLKLRQASYDDMEDGETVSKEEREFNQDAVKIASRAIALLYYNRASNQEEFEKMLKELFEEKAEPQTVPEPTQEEAPKVDAPEALETVAEDGDKATQPS